MLSESNHVENALEMLDLDKEEGNNANAALPKAHDLHAILAILLEPCIMLQGSRFAWDLPCRDRVHKKIEFVLFAPFVKCDSDEADKLCGKHGSRTGNVANLCRCCMCPTDDSDNCLANYDLKNTTVDCPLSSQKTA